MQQYMETKNQYKDCILFYRLGDFYEMFFDDALCVTKGYTWKEAYCKLIAVAGKIGQMPQYPKTIRELLHEEGFFLQAKTNVNKCIREIIADCNHSFHDGEVVILNLSV